MSNEQPNYEISVRKLCTPGNQAILTVRRPGDRDSAPYVQQQMPADFAEYIKGLHEANKPPPSPEVIRLVPIDGGPHPL